MKNIAISVVKPWILATVSTSMLGYEPTFCTIAFCRSRVDFLMHDKTAIFVLRDSSWIQLTIYAANIIANSGDELPDSISVYTRVGPPSSCNILRKDCMMNAGTSRRD